MTVIQALQKGTMERVGLKDQEEASFWYKLEREPLVLV